MLTKTKATKEQLLAKLEEAYLEIHEQQKRLVILSRQRDLAVAENAQMSAALADLAAEKEGTPGWWKLLAWRWQMEAVRLRDGINYTMSFGGWSIDPLIKHLKFVIATVDADKPKPVPRP